MSCEAGRWQADVTGWGGAGAKTRSPKARRREGPKARPHGGRGASAPGPYLIAPAWWAAGLAGLADRGRVCPRVAAAAPARRPEPCHALPHGLPRREPYNPPTPETHTHTHSESRILKESNIGNLPAISYKVIYTQSYTIFKFVGKFFNFYSFVIHNFKKKIF